MSELNLTDTDNNQNEDACPLRAIDEVLLYNANVSQEQREEIMEQAFRILYNQWPRENT